jgi:drug/metabolite transporter (DMT)-like permease
VASHHLRGITAMLGAVASFAGLDTFIKLLTEHYSTMQVTALRGLTALPFVIVPVLIFRRHRELVPRRFHMHVLRGALTLLVMVTFVYAVRVLSLADAYAIFLAAPLIVTGLSVPLLGERVDARRWIAISIGLMGAVAMLRPSASNLVTLGALAAFVSALAYALNAIALRVLTRTDTTTSVVFWSLVLLTAFSLTLAWPDWKPVQPDHWKWLLGMGVFGAVAVHLLTEAFRSAPPPVVAPFEYTALLWGVLIDWLVWSTAPSSRVFVGGGIVVATGLYLIWREKQLQEQRTAALDVR